MNHRETIAHYERLKQEKAEKAADWFIGVLADAISPFVVDGKISKELGGEIMIALMKRFQESAP